MQCRVVKQNPNCNQCNGQCYGSVTPARTSDDNPNVDSETKSDVYFYNPKL